MKFKMYCPFCHQKVEAEEEWQGQQAECPCCSEKFVIMKPENNTVQPVINIQINNENQFAKGQNSNAYVPPGLGMQAPRYVPNHMTKAVLSLLFCTLPLGFMSIVYALQVDNLVKRGDYDGAEKASQNADMWFWIAVGSSLILAFLIAAGQS